MSTHRHSKPDPRDREALRWASARESTWPGESAPARVTSQPPTSVIRTREDASTPLSAVGRYALGPEIGRGGMATVHLGMLEGASGFRRPVAIKRVRGPLACSPDAWDRLRREGLIGAAIRHPNVVAVLDLVAKDEEVWVVMEYVMGETLGHLLRLDSRPPIAIAIAIMTGVLRGLHAAHNATGPTGKPLGIVHRDVSPQNILVGADGFARVLDFGVAKSVGSEATRVGHVKGKVGYFAPEQVLDEPVSPSTDIFAAGIVLWEAIAGRRMFAERDVLLGMEAFMTLGAEAPSLFNCEVPSALDAVLACALERTPQKRFRNAEDFAIALERVTPPASPSQVSRYLRDTFSSSLGSQRSLLHSSAGYTPVTRIDGVSDATSHPREALLSAELDEKTALMFAHTRGRLRSKTVLFTAVALLVLAGAWLLGLAIAPALGPAERSHSAGNVASKVTAPALPSAEAVKQGALDTVQAPIRVEDLPLLAPPSEPKLKKPLAPGR